MGTIDFFKDEEPVNISLFGICDDEDEAGIFKSCHVITAFRHRVAYACNKKHPSFACSHKEYMQRFRNEHNVRLIIDCHIVLK